jgi:hypothetical protein
MPVTTQSLHACHMQVQRSLLGETTRLQPAAAADACLLLLADLDLLHHAKLGHQLQQLWVNQLW